jgi:hypothetical protein
MNESTPPPTNFLIMENKNINPLPNITPQQLEDMRVTMSMMQQLGGGASIIGQGEAGGMTIPIGTTPSCSLMEQTAVLLPSSNENHTPTSPSHHSPNPKRRDMKFTPGRKNISSHSEDATSACFTWMHRTYGIHSTQQAESVHSVIARFCCVTRTFLEITKDLEQMAEKHAMKSKMRDMEMLLERTIESTALFTLPMAKRIGAQLTPFARKVLNAQTAQIAMYKCTKIHSGSAILSQSTSNSSKLLCSFETMKRRRYQQAW